MRYLICMAGISIASEARAADSFAEVCDLRPAMIAAANRVLRDAAAAEDVVQDVLLDLWLRPEAYDPARGGRRSYVLMLTRSRALDRWRSRSARAAMVDRATQAATAEPAVTASAADEALRRDGAARLTEMLGELPDPQREAILLAYGRGLTAQEVAAAVGVPLGTAKSRLRLGLSRARMSLAAAS